MSFILAVRRRLKASDEPLEPLAGRPRYGLCPVVAASVWLAFGPQEQGASSPAAAFGPGMVFDVLPGCAQLAVAADAAVADDRFDGGPVGRGVSLPPTSTAG